MYKDHPRIRGEHVGWAWEGVKTVGSSPHTRGAPQGAADVAAQEGIIPAYAGSTRDRARTTDRHPDHPRIRGEHGAAATMTSSARGSSPHTRGARICVMWALLAIRIIPAYAGSTDVLVSIHRSDPDHPRIRGEHIDLRPA